jgi:hypothetical protein
MPGSDPNAVIVFDDGDSINTQSSVEEIEKAIADVTTRHVPLVTVVDEGGADVRINVNHIRAFHRYV